MIIMDHEQGSREWYTARAGLPTASRFSEIITAVKGNLSKSAIKLAAKLVAEQHMGIPDDLDAYFTRTKAMDQGAATEHEARLYFEALTGEKVRQVGLCLTDDRRFGCSPDGLIGETSGVEIKCPLAATHALYLYNGGLPDDYKPQVHGSMWVTGRREWHFFSYSPIFPELHVRVEWGEYTDKLGEALEGFYPILEAMRQRIKELTPALPVSDEPDTSAEEADEDLGFAED